MFTSFLYLTYIVYQMSAIMSTLFKNFFVVSQMRETTYSLRTLMRTSVTSSGIRNLSFRIYSQFVVFRHRFFVSSSTRNVVYLLYAGLTQRTFIGFLKYLLCSFILRSMSFVVPILKMRSPSPI